MRLLIIVAALAAMLNADWYGDDGDSGGYNSGQQQDRGYAQPGDDNWNNQESDKMIYGDDNHYEGSRPGDDDWGQRNMERMLDD